MSRAPRKQKPTAAPVPRSQRELQIEQWELDRLVPYARNSRTHSPQQVADIARSIERFGFTNPVLVGEDGTIIAGHGRTLAAKQLGLKTVPVIIAGDWSDEERRAYVIADNKLALDAGWDEELLKLELGELASAGFDLELTGFKEDDLNELFGTVDPDDIAAQVQPPDVKAVYQILVECGDEARQLELLTELQARGIECRALIA